MRNDSFENELAAIDSLLQSSGVPIPQRPIKTWLELGRRRQDTTGTDVLNRISEWYERRYGREKLLVRMELGRMPLLIGGEICLARIPIVFGRVRLNVFKFIEVTEELVSALALAEKAKTFNAWMTSYEQFSSVQHFSSCFFKTLANTDAQGLYQVAEADLHTAAACLEHFNTDIEGSASGASRRRKNF